MAEQVNVKLNNSNSFDLMIAIIQKVGSMNALENEVVPLYKKYVAAIAGIDG